jgi:hypothetical protein
MPAAADDILLQLAMEAGLVSPSEADAALASAPANAVNALTSLIEPLMIVVMAVMVGTIVIALFLPIVRIIQSLG